MATLRSIIRNLSILNYSRISSSLALTTVDEKNKKWLIEQVKNSLKKTNLELKGSYNNVNIFVTRSARNKVGHKFIPSSILFKTFHLIVIIYFPIIKLKLISIMLKKLPPELKQD